MTSIGGQQLVPGVVVLGVDPGVDLGGLGRTSQREVHLGREVRLGRLVRVTLLRASTPATAASFVNALRRVGAATRHPTLSTIHDVGHIDDHRVYAVEECPTGDTLDRRLRDTGPLTVLDAVHLGERMATGLQRLHEVGVAHGSVAASSVGLDRWDRPQLTDIGVAALQGRHCSEADDVRGLAATVEVAMTGASASDGDAARLRALGAEPDLADLLASCHHTDPTGRPTAAEVATAFGDLRRAIVCRAMAADHQIRMATHLDLEESPTSQAGQPEPRATAGDRSTDRHRTLRSRGDRRPVSLVLAAMAVLMVVGLVVLPGVTPRSMSVAAGSSDPKDPPPSSLADPASSTPSAPAAPTGMAIDGIDVVAGEGLQVGGPATRLRLVRGEGIAVAPDGGYFLADRAAHRVYRVESDGTVHVAAGTGHPGYDGDGGPATAASLHDPHGLAAHDGALYITDRGNGVIRRVEADGTINTVAGGADSRLSVSVPPHAIAVDPAGRLFVSTLDPGAVLLLTPDGEERLVAGADGSASSVDAGPAVQTVLEVPTGLAWDGSGLLVLELGRGPDAAGRVRRLVERPTTGGWEIEEVAGADGLNRPEGIAVQPDGTVLVTSTFDNQVVAVARGERRVIAGDGRTATDGDGGAAAAAALNRPKGIAVGDDGAVLVAEGSSPVVRRIADGRIDTVVGRLSTSSAVAADRLPLVLPGPLDVSPAGGVVVADLATGEVVEIAEGTARRRTRGIAQIDAPGGIALAADGTIYVSATLDHVVYALAPDGVLEVVAGQVGLRAPDLTEAMLGDGIPADSALLNTPRGLDVHGDTLYIADSGSHRIRAVDAEGIIHTVVGSGSSGGFVDGPAAEARLDTPVDLDVAGDRLVIIDAQNHAVRQMDLVTGTLTTLAGTGRAGHRGGDGDIAEVELSLPLAISIDRQGRVAVADTSNRRVLELSDGRSRTLLGPSDLPLLRPVGIGVAADGTLDVVDQSARRIWGLSR